MVVFLQSAKLCLKLKIYCFYITHILKGEEIIKRKKPHTQAFPFASRFGKSVNHRLSCFIVR